MKLVKEVQDHVFSKTGKRLECEIKIFDWIHILLRY
jgi:UDP-N-acetylenolpyruvoylglucosamine reductase